MFCLFLGGLLVDLHVVLLQGVDEGLGDVPVQADARHGVLGYIYIYIYMYTYIYTYYVYLYICMYPYSYVYICIARERERDIY